MQMQFVERDGTFLDQRDMPDTLQPQQTVEIKGRRRVILEVGPTGARPGGVQPVHAGDRGGAAV